MPPGFLFPNDIISRAIGEAVATETTLGAALWTIKADESALENALLNLCVNARRHAGRWQDHH